MNIDIYNETKSRIYTNRLRNVASIASGYLNFKKPVSIAIVNSSSIKKLNKMYRGMNKPTDVLSFAMGRDSYEVSGEVIICYDVAKEQAIKEKTSVIRRIEKLLVHGMVHISGRDHKTDAEAIAMESIENKILKKIRN